VALLGEGIWETANSLLSSTAKTKQGSGRAEQSGAERSEALDAVLCCAAVRETRI